MLYAVTGGIPKYMELYRGGGIMGFIKDNILDPDGYLYPEAEFLLSREVTDTRGSIPLMAAIAGGCSKMEEIAGRLGVRQTDITRTLSILRETGLVARDIPATETSRSRSRRGLYRIADGYMRFWLMYVYPFQDMLESRHPEYVIRRIGETMDTNFMPAAYEDVCRESVWGLKELEGVITPTRVGRYWGRDAGETDVVVLDDVLKKVMVGECKYSSSPKDIRMLEGMQEKLEAMASLTGYEPAGIVLFSMSGFTEGMRKHAERDGIILVSGPGIPVSSPGTMEIDNSGSLRVPREIFYRPPFYDTA
jgi:AAA+ ATPase superfamily predicted ATPase